MALCEMKLKGVNALNRMTGFMAIVPEGRPGPFPVLYLLHGYSDDYTAWVRRTSIERYADQYPMIVVMPDGGHGWYTDADAVPYSRFETYIAKDLIGFVDTVFPTVSDRHGRAIAGLSMGGYGALKFAVKHPELFSAAHSFSGAVEIATHDENSLSTARRWENDIPWTTEHRLIFGASPKDGAEDLAKLIVDADPTTLPSISFDCGVDDFLIEDNRRFHALLTERRIPHSYEEFTGTHDWAYWDAHLPAMLARMAAVFRIDGSSTPAR